jgi:hypothetical protein
LVQCSTADTMELLLIEFSPDDHPSPQHHPLSHTRVLQTQSRSCSNLVEIAIEENCLEDGDEYASGIYLIPVIRHTLSSKALSGQ